MLKFKKDADGRSHVLDIAAIDVDTVSLVELSEALDYHRLMEAHRARVSVVASVKARIHKAHSPAAMFGPFATYRVY